MCGVRRTVAIGRTIADSGASHTGQRGTEAGTSIERTV